jgi:hypothetical protein
MIYILTILSFTLQIPGLDKDPGFQLSEEGKIVFIEQINDVDSEIDLEVNAKHFLTILGEEDEMLIAKSEGEMVSYQTTTGFKLYRKSIGKTPYGKVSYRIKIEIKENRYRYIITDLVFKEYERNRYARFVPSKKKAQPIEKYLDDPSKAWQRYLNDIESKVGQTISDLKQELMESRQSSKVDDISKVNISQDW